MFWTGLQMPRLRKKIQMLHEEEKENRAKRIDELLFENNFNATILPIYWPGIRVKIFKMRKIK